ncbi:hypothetical protein BD626DRAFT_519357 [Schizophyllum amplum]|uniref:F-box domain-containing protein n=1 Tax=Schizophyllum amplum TaxID=97359 RepID=A0A550BVB8_9AGAR|nr:hypothetical protein BD626DRAFT_519357 [Auriculariopsis ampla]
MSGERESCQLLDLPSELLARIAGSLHPYDIRAVSETCRPMHVITKLKEVWLSAARRICYESNVFEPTFELPAMDVCQLDRIATAPRRFMRLLADGRPYDLLSSVTARAVSLKAPHGVPCLAPDDGFRRVWLVPGGRFMVAQSKRHIHIWDLGSWLYSVPEKIPSRRRQLYWANTRELLGIPASEDDDRVWLNDCHQSEDAMSLLFTMQQQCDAEGEGGHKYWKLFVLRARFTEAPGSDDNGASAWNVDVRVLSCLQIPRDALTSSFTVRKVDDAITVVSTKSEIFIWRYNHASVAYWPSYAVGELSELTRIQAVHVTPDYVVCAHDSAILTYRIPEFRPADSMESWRRSLLEPCQVSRLARDLAIWTSPRPWHLAQAAQTISKTLEQFSLSEGITRYNVVQNAETEPEVRYVERGYVGTKLGFEDDPAFEDLCNMGAYLPGLDPCDGNGAVCLYQNAPHQVMALAYGGGRQLACAAIPMHAVHTSYRASLRTWSMCPSSGRLCYASAQGPRKVMILDFLPSSNA